MSNPAAATVKTTHKLLIKTQLKRAYFDYRYEFYCIQTLERAHSFVDYDSGLEFESESDSDSESLVNNDRHKAPYTMAQFKIAISSTDAIFYSFSSKKVFGAITYKSTNGRPIQEVRLMKKRAQSQEECERSAMEFEEFVCVHGQVVRRIID